MHVCLPYPTAARMQVACAQSVSRRYVSTAGWSLKVVRGLTFLRVPYPTAADLLVLVVEALVEVLVAVLVGLVEVLVEVLFGTRVVVQSACPIDRCNARC